MLEAVIKYAIYMAAQYIHIRELLSCGSLITGITGGLFGLHGNNWTGDMRQTFATARYLDAFPNY